MSSSFLFARPSFLSGAARVLDLGGSFDRYNTSRTAEEADVRALISDWLAVRHDLNAVVGRLLAQHPELMDELNRIDRAQDNDDRQDASDDHSEASLAAAMHG